MTYLNALQLTHISAELTPEQVAVLVFAGVIITISLTIYGFLSRRNGSGHV